MPKTEMTQEELAQAIKEIIQENRDHGHLMKPKAIKCGRCKKWIARTLECSLYPKGIPNKILEEKENCEAFEQK